MKEAFEELDAPMEKNKDDELDLSLLSPFQRYLFDRILDGENICVAGSGGVGKSFLLSYISKAAEGVYITASTGIAALNVGGTTLQSFLGLPPFDKIDADALSQVALSKSDRITTLNNCKMLILEEISMIDADFLDLAGKTRSGF